MNKASRRGRNGRSGEEGRIFLKGEDAERLRWKEFLRGTKPTKE
jgi:hypothetical protein